ncbi:thiol:disulfide interchange protein DsbA/DsbL [Salinimonas sediminis]|uniref:Thiol:disulfide interchange protein n=1 Tax=Salinimonas sediminis TaxID=2303538 RepID=A0A346NIL2_9ALTE|nr:thiol:disulfide interchange protein DsbA/DsbL [Salinimonas sediminis]AXR05369.1 thiol:disulfide interchange protein DsbA/DsbL [Salinimonas sediminis]
MKKFALLLVMALLVPLQACAADAKWEEGTHYTVLDEPATDKPVITEFFSFWCPHCYQFESLVKDIKSKMSKDTQFNKIHVNFMGFTSTEIQDDATRAMMIARAIKQEDALNGAIFDYIHKQRASVTGLEDLRNIFVVNGVDKAEFDKMATSFGVNNMLKKNNKELDQFRQYVRGVPNFIVNGRYQAQFTSDMSKDDIVDLIVWLSNKD